MNDNQEDEDDPYEYFDTNAGTFTVSHMSRSQAQSARKFELEKHNDRVGWANQDIERIKGDMEQEDSSDQRSSS